MGNCKPNRFINFFLLSNSGEIKKLEMSILSCQRTVIHEITTKPEYPYRLSTLVIYFRINNAQQWPCGSQHCGEFRWRGGLAKRRSNYLS